jgi:hypothetical protein
VGFAGRGVHGGHAMAPCAPSRRGGVVSGPGTTRAR